ncbi:hypothetical protein PIB30_007626 [Stylosanthes scabra]|uniref:Transmembrane protein n=1 Tax=Stylosanthes scabra TaxID=79078 RepID=A0ABU6V4F3_9FABA|nr:hypothetical protein [Stylosanthes scabra]
MSLLPPSSLSKTREKEDANSDDEAGSVDAAATVGVSLMAILLAATSVVVVIEPKKISKSNQMYMNKLNDFCMTLEERMLVVDGLLTIVSERNDLCKYLSK